MPNPLLKCPRCPKGLAQRVAPRSVVEELLAALLTYPFQCQGCDHRFTACRLGSTYRNQREDRRESDRIPVRFSATFSGNQVRGEGMVVNISKGGCKIETDSKIPTGALLYLQLFLSEAQAPVEVAGSVRSARDGRIGVKFLRIAKEEKRLQEFIQWRAERTGRLRR